MIKIFHILSAAILLMGMSICVLRYIRSGEILSIQRQSFFLILPFALLQLFTGFTMMSLKHDELTALWIKGSLVGFISLLISWFIFVIAVSLKKQTSGTRLMQRVALVACGIAILVMIFMMANKI